MVDCPFEVRTLRGDVDADEAIAPCAEYVAAIEPKLRFVFDETLQLPGVETERAAIDPGEIGALRFDELQFVRAVFEQFP